MGPRMARLWRLKNPDRDGTELATAATEIVGAGLTDGFVDAAGARVHYVRAGEGRPMVLIHGLVGSAANWRRNMGALASDACVYAIDLVNMGQSERVEGLDASLAATADQVAACMDALGLEQADIAAHSHGGGVALMLAARHPERVRSLILFAPINPFSASGDLLVKLYSTGLGRQIARLAPHLPRRVQLFGLGRMYGDPRRIVDGCLQGYIDGMRVPGTIGHILAIVRGWFKEMEALKAALPRVTAPTLLVWGDRDRAVDPASAMQVKRVLVQAELRVVRGAGHIVFEEMPEIANGLMREWLQRDVAASGAGPEVSAAEQLYVKPRPVARVGRAKVGRGLPRLSTGT
jgi:pimeloyl-ACP methyl ester carboxylesterase